MLLLHIKVQYDYSEIHVQEIQKEQIIDCLKETAVTERSYVLQVYEDCEPLHVLKNYNKDQMSEFLYDNEVTGNLIAKYDLTELI